MMQTNKINALVYCEGAFNTPNGKTAHGLVRFTERYHIVAVIDSTYVGQDAGTVLDVKPNGIPIFSLITEALPYAKRKNTPIDTLVVGIAPDGGRLSAQARKDVECALENGLNIASGLHDFISDDLKFAKIARDRHLTICDIRKPPLRNQLHFFSGKIEEVNCLKIAVLGTDSAVGKRTTAWLLVHALRASGMKSEMIGTGQTAWMQGAKYSIIMDSLINDFVSGEIEHAVYSAWKEAHPDVIVIEGQGSLMNPAYPGGFEILAAGRPDFVILQHAPCRADYDGFPGYPIHPINQQIQAIELLSGKKVFAVTINHENMNSAEIPKYCEEITEATGLPAFDVLHDGPEQLVKLITKQFVDHA